MYALPFYCDATLLHLRLTFHHAKFYAIVITSHTFVSGALLCLSNALLKKVPVDCLFTIFAVLLLSGSIQNWSLL